jgi:methionyl-tRNA formyltransferase
MAGLRLIFMGTPDFSVPALKQLIKAGHHIVCVYSQPPRPAGRGQKARLSPVHMFAKAEGLKVRTPKSFETEGVLSEFSDLSADVAVVVAYGLILPKAALGAPKLGCINIHASLLPRWRGAAPIQRAIQAGDRKSGVTIMQMGEGLDTGNILVVQETPLYMGIIASELHDRLSNMGASLIVTTLDSLLDGGITPVKQTEVGVTYAAKLKKTEGLINWSRPALEIHRLTCAFSPWPGVWFKHKGERIKVFSINTLDMVKGGIPGTILDDQLTIACGEGAIQIIELQRPGKKRELTADFLRGYPIDLGTCLKVTKR